MLAGARLLRQMPSLVTWSVLGELVAGMLKATPPAVLLAAIIVRAQLASPQTAEEALAWLVGTASWLLSPEMIVGGVGIMGTVWVSAWVLGVAIDSGVLGALKRRIADPEGATGGLFWRGLGERFWALMAWGAVRWSLVGAWAALTAMMAWAGWRAATLAFGDAILTAPWGPPMAALIVALGAALGASGVALAAATCHLALGPLILEEKGVFEALADSAAFVRRHLVEVVWLYLLVFVLFFVVLAVWTPFFGVALSLGGQAKGAMAGALMRVFIDVVLTIGLAVATIWGRAGALSYFAIRTGRMTRMPSLRSRVEDVEVVEAVKVGEIGAGAGAEEESGAGLEGEPDRPAGSVEALLPERCESVVELGEIRRRMKG